MILYTWAVGCSSKRALLDSGSPATPEARRGVPELKDRKQKPPSNDRGEVEFPWDDDSFFEEDTSEYTEIDGEEVERTRGRKATRVDAADPETTAQIFEDTDPPFEDTDRSVDDTSEILDDDEEERATASQATIRLAALTPEERFFPDVPELAGNKEDSQISGLLRTADDISRIISLNRPRPGPFLKWYFALEPIRRQRVYRALWMFSASTLIITLFTIATVVIFPLMEDRFTATFGPRPDHPVRFLPDAGAAFALVEDRPYRHDRFIAGMDCIWVTRAPVGASKIAGFGPYLMQDDEIIALLDAEETWNGMARLYFRRGNVPLDEPVDLVIPVEGGGTVPVDLPAPGYRIYAQGGDTPARVVLGPVVFKEAP